MMLFSQSRTSFRRAAAGAALAAAALVSATACGGDTAPGEVLGMIVQVIPLSTPTTNVLRGITIQLQATPFNADSDFVVTPITWTSSDNAKATVDANGLVTTVAGGDVTISATAGGKTGTFPINIQFPVGTVTLATPASIRNEATVALTPVLVGTDGKAAVGRTVTWTSSNTAVATVNSSGVVSSLTNGTTTITATSEGVSGTTVVTVSGAALIASVTVTPATPFGAIGQTIQLTQTDKAASGTTITGVTPTWTSSTNSVATVSATGLVTCVAAGSSTMTATVNNGIGTNVTGTTAVTCAISLLSGVSTAVGNFAESAISTYAVIVPAGTTNLTVATSGGTGDSDLYGFAPGVTPSALNTSGSVFPNYTNSTAVSGNNGNGESISVTNPAAGTWRFISYAFTGGGAVSGMSVKATIVP